VTESESESAVPVAEELENPARHVPAGCERPAEAGPQGLLLVVVNSHGDHVRVSGHPAAGRGRGPGRDRGTRARAFGFTAGPVTAGVTRCNSEYRDYY
jgi:hypothetical protein